GILKEAVAQRSELLLPQRVGYRLCLAAVCTSDDLLLTAVLLTSPLKKDHFRWERSPDGYSGEPEVAVQRRVYQRTSTLTHRNHYTDAKTFGKTEEDSGRMQLNSKFVNNMLPEWSRFITEVKLNRGLKESNCDQLYAYLKQHEVHANENRIMMERFGQPNNDPLALVSDASVQQYPTQSSTSPQSSTNSRIPSDNFQMNSGSSSTENLIENEESCAQESVEDTLSNNTRKTNSEKQYKRNGVVWECRRNRTEEQYQSLVKQPIQSTTVMGLGHIARNVQGQSDFQDSDYFQGQDAD
ncbi:hypothetical protein Tco_0912383, partial [Tanacetum coccineum]